MLRAWVTQAIWLLFGSWSFLLALVFIEVHLCASSRSLLLFPRSGGSLQDPLKRVGEGTVMQLSAPLPRIPLL